MMCLTLLLFQIKSVDADGWATPDYDRLTLHPVKAIIVSHSKSDYDWKRSQQYFEESVHKRRPEKVSMNVEVTIFIICGNCSMTTKYPSESIDM